MNPGKRPLAVTILGWLYIAVGVIGFGYHLTEFRTGNAFPNDLVWAELTELVALVCGVFILRGHNWARWVAVAWMAFHVILSVNVLSEFAIHCVFCAAIAWFLFRPEAGRYFRRASIEGA